MSDEFDKASEAEELHREMAIKAIRAREHMKFSGHCVYCNETIKQGSFCGAECREDYELEQKFKRITGKR